jgi:hypothetical protein
MFRVDWLQTALDQLTTIWMSAGPAQRQAITAAAHRIEQQLQADPFTASESRPQERRILFLAALRQTDEPCPFFVFGTSVGEASRNRITKGKSLSAILLREPYLGLTKEAAEHSC